MLSAGQWLLAQNRFNSKRKLKQTITISVTGGKGGVGKTSLSIKMAQILAGLDYKVLLVDFDYNLSNIPIKLNQNLNEDFFSLVTGTKTFEQVVRTSHSFDYLSGCHGNRDLFNHKKNISRPLLDIIRNCEKKYDIIIFDCPAGLNHEALLINTYSDYRFFVVTPENSSITDSYALMKILKNEFGVNENHLLLNKISSNQEKNKIVRSLMDTSLSFLNCRLRFLGTLENVNISIDKFNKFILEEENSFHKRLTKILTDFFEEVSVSHGPNHHNENLRKHAVTI